MILCSSIMLPIVLAFFLFYFRLYIFLFILICRRPTTVEDRTKYSVDDQDRDYDVAALANNFSKAFQYGAYDRDFIDEVYLCFLCVVEELTLHF